MLKSELPNHLASRVSKDYLAITEKMATECVDSILQQMVVSLSKGDRIEIRGFGSFTVRYRLPRKARNPRTGETVKTRAKYLAHFKPGKPLRDRVNKF